MNDISKREWPSIDEFVNEVKNKPVITGAGFSTKGMGGIEWYGTHTFDDAIQQAENGWPDGLCRIKTLYSSLKPIEGEKSDRHVMRHAEVGDEVDIGRYVTNEPECMVDFDVVQVPAVGRVIKLIVNVNASASMSAEALFLRGSAGVMLADLIDQSGLRSEIWVISRGSYSSKGIDWRVLVKAPDQPLELDRVAFALASPAMLRRLMFRAYETCSAEIYGNYIGSGYTHPLNPDPEPGTILIDCLQYGFGNNLTNETVPKFVQAMLNSFLET